MKAKHWIILGAVIGIFLLGRTCGIRSVLKTVHIDTIIHKDSEVVKYKPVPYKVVEKEKVYVKGKDNWLHDTTNTLEVRIEPVDTAAILKDYYATVYYDTTLKLKRGTARIRDTVSRNRIQGSSLETFNTDTTIKETTVLHPPGKIIVYWGVDYLANRKYPFYAGGVNLSVKFPKDQIITGGILIDRNNKLIYQGGLKFPIRLLKHIVKKSIP